MSNIYIPLININVEHLFMFFFFWPFLHLFF
jgi:hypothetical protein